MQPKQTGPAGLVKGHTGVTIATLACLLALGACSSAADWSNPTKSVAETRADDTTCSKEAEDDALLRAGKARADYGAPPAGPTPGGYGQSPMQMHDRDVTTRDFRDLYERCMESKGYVRGKSKS